jgi:putative spermidine/putrescine transport system permease protein
MAPGPGGGSRAASYLQVAPLFLVLLFFVGLPLVMIVTVSFWEYDEFEFYPSFTLANYADVLTSPTTWALYLETLKNAFLTWLITLLIGFTVSYFLVFHVRSLLWQIALFLVCTVPFWTSNIIRMISWIPFLGRNGLFNQALMGAGITSEPLEFLLFSDFAVILSYVHLFTLFMVVPIFNSMARIDPTLLEAARDAGAKPWQVVWEVVVPLCRTGIALGSIFVIALVMGDFFVVRVLSGGQSGSVVSAMQNIVQNLEYPLAAAHAVVLIAVVVLMVGAILRVVDIRKELAS